MKSFLSIVLLAFGLVCFAQDDKKVEENNEKIGELNDRLDRLINGSTQISGDSINIKIDRLISDIKEIKTEIQVLKQTVNKISEEGVSKSNDENTEELAKLETKLKDLDEGVYYVILASAKYEEYGKKTQNRLAKNGLQVRLVQNARETWYHIILDQEYTLAEAIQKVEEIKKSKFSDAWFMTGRKLK